MNNEVWADIENFEVDYEVSSFGNVRNKKNNKIRKAYKSDGYLSVSLVKNGKWKNLRIHRLVANAFCNNPNDYDIVDHINGSRDDNHYKNLRYCTSKENSRNRKKTTKKTSSIYKGVCLEIWPFEKKWVANIYINGKLECLGRYESEKEAGKIYNLNAMKHFTKFAKLNVISDSDDSDDSDSDDSDSD